jgi:hypothetical protein
MGKKKVSLLFGVLRDVYEQTVGRTGGLHSQALVLCAIRETGKAVGWERGE